MKINVFNDAGFYSIDTKIIKKIIRKVLKNEAAELNQLNVIIADNKYLKNLNRLFFKKNRTTNVISFNMGEVAEIYVSKDRSHDHKELVYYILHGLLHIIGYDHKNKDGELLMEKKCFDYMSDV